MNQVEKDRFIRWQLDAIEVVDCPTGHSGRLQVGDKVYIHRFDPPDTDASILGDQNETRNSRDRYSQWCHV